MYLIKGKKETPVFYFHLLNNIKKKLQYVYKALKMDRDTRLSNLEDSQSVLRDKK